MAKVHKKKKKSPLLTEYFNTFANKNHCTNREYFKTI